MSTTRPGVARRDRRAAASARQLLRAIVLRGHAEEAEEGAAHGVRAAESSGGGDLFECLVGLLKFTTRGFNAHMHDVLRRRDADLARKDAAQNYARS